MDPPRTFVSYTQDSPHHAGRVLALTEQLRQDGVDARIDRYVLSPDEGWPRWIDRQIESAGFVLVVCSADYTRGFRDEQVGSNRRAAAWASSAILRHLYDAGANNHRFVPVFFDGDDPEIVPERLRGVTVYGLPRDYESLLRRLTGQPEIVAGALGTSRMPRAAVASSGFWSSTASSPSMELDDSELLPGVKELEVLRDERDDARLAGRPTQRLDEAIKRIRRRLREGAQLKIGDSLSDGRYRLIEAIGRGNYGTVWMAYDRSVQRAVALKVLHGQHADNGPRIERFFRGARIMARLDHPNIARVYQEHCVEGVFNYYVLEYLPGGDLGEAVREHRLAYDGVVPCILQVASALEYAPAKDCIHRDVKPANILFDAHGTPKLSDFDLVWDAGTTGGTGSDETLGTFLYSPPIRASKQPDARADVYGLGMTLVFALKGEISIDVLQDPHEFLRGVPCSPALREVLHRAIRLREEQRYPSMQAFHEALEDAQRPTPDAAQAAPADRLLAPLEAFERRIRPTDPLVIIGSRPPPPSTTQQVHGTQSSPARSTRPARPARPARVLRVMPGVLSIIVLVVGWLLVNGKFGPDDESLRLAIPAARVAARDCWLSEGDKCCSTFSEGRLAHSLYHFLVTRIAHGSGPFRAILECTSVGPTSASGKNQSIEGHQSIEPYDSVFDRRMKPFVVVIANAIFRPEPDRSALGATRHAMFDKRPGTNETSFCVDVDGKTVEVKTKKNFRNDAKVDEICRDTIKRWRFRPFIVGGKAMRICSIAEFNFSFH